MSMMRCNQCDGFIDTDFDVEGVFEQVNPFRFWCSQCVEDVAESEGAEHPAMIAMKSEDPKRFEELTTDA